MSSLSHPGTLIAIGDAVGILGVFVYNYKKIGGLQEENEKIKTQINTSIARVTNNILEIDKHIAQFGILCARLQDTVIKLKKQVKKQDFRQKIIISALKKGGVEFKGDLSLSPSSRHESSSDEEDDEEGADDNSENDDEEDDNKSKSRKKKHHVRFKGKKSDEMSSLVMKASASEDS
jgi:hypothetical protein